MPKVSVVIPVYGVEKYIERCARSLFEQTLEDIEYIFVDDCTKDNSIAILECTLKEYPNRIPQTTIIHHEVNKGLPQARNTGVLASTGEYIAHCDSDDWVDKEMYNSMYNKAKEQDADLVVSNYNMCSNSISRHNYGYYSMDKKSFILDMMYMKVAWAVWNKLVKKDLYTGNIIYPHQCIGEDMVLTLQLCYKANRIAFDEGFYYQYFLNDMSSTHVKEVIKIFDKYIQLKENTEIINKFIIQNTLDSEYRKALDGIYLNLMNNIWPIIDKQKYYICWVQVYKNLSHSFLFNSNISLKCRLHILLTKFHVIN